MKSLNKVPTEQLVEELVGREEEKNTTYTVEDINSLGYPRSVKMSFELLYRDWCIFEKSELFQNLTSYLAELQMQRSPNVLQEKQD